MITIKKDEYTFLVDVKKTKKYYNNHSLCNCLSCRNYYIQIKEKLPKLDLFLSEFGVDISRPDEISSIEMNNYIDYINVDYTVCGKIKEMGIYEIDIYDNLFLSIIVNDKFVCPNEQTEDYFTISVMQIRLPWVLEEPFPKPIKEKLNKKSNILKKIIKSLIN